MFLILCYVVAGDAFVLYDPPKVKVHCVGDTVVLKCTSSTNFPLEWTFTPSNDASSHSDSALAGISLIRSKTELYNNSTLLLMIRGLRVDDAGVYQCAEINSQSANVIESVQLVIMEG